MLPINLRAPGPHTCATLLSPSFLGTSQITRHDPKNLSTLFFYNLSQYVLISGYINTFCSKHQGRVLLRLARFIVIIQLVIWFYNALMKLCCDPCYPQVSIPCILGIWRWWWSISCTISPEQYGGFKISTVVWTKTHSSFTPILFGVILLADFFVFYNSPDHW